MSALTWLACEWDKEADRLLTPEANAIGVGTGRIYEACADDLRRLIHRHFPSAPH